MLRNVFLGEQDFMPFVGTFYKYWPLSPTRGFKRARRDELVVVAVVAVFLKCSVRYIIFLFLTFLLDEHQMHAIK